MPGPATKLGSLTAHGGSVIGPGCPTVLINNVPAIRVGADMHVCPMFTGYVPHVGMNNIGPGVPTVLIGGLPASTVGDNFLCAGPPAPVVMGAFNVLIGTGAGGGGGSGGGGSSTTMEELKSGKIKPPKGTESLPLEIQAVMAECQPSIPPESFKRRVEQLVLDYGETDQKEPPEKITIADFVEILEAIEREEGYEAARFFASHLDFGTLTSIAMGFISGDDPNPDNDPNIMPTRFMILYGADDAKLQQIDDHPDCADGEEHKMNVANLRKGLRLLGYAVEDGSVYDEYVYMAHLQYMARCASRNAIVSSLADLSSGLSEDQSVRELNDGSKMTNSEKTDQTEGNSADDATTEEEDVPIGCVIVQLTDRKGNPYSKVECTLKSSKGIVGSGTTDIAGYYKWIDMPLDNYKLSVKLDNGNAEVTVPWSSSDKQSHTTIIRN